MLMQLLMLRDMHCVPIVDLAYIVAQLDFQILKSNTMEQRFASVLEVMSYFQIRKCAWLHS